MSFERTLAKPNVSDETRKVTRGPGHDAGLIPARPGDRASRGGTVPVRVLFDTLPRHLEPEEFGVHQAVTDGENAVALDHMRAATSRRTP